MTFQMDDEEFFRQQNKSKSPIQISQLLDINYCDLILWMIEHEYKLNFSRANIHFERRAATLWKQGCTDRELSNEMGVTVNCITGWRARRGLTPNKREDKIQ